METKLPICPHFLKFVALFVTVPEISVFMGKAEKSATAGTHYNGHTIHFLVEKYKIYFHLDSVVPRPNCLGDTFGPFLTAVVRASLGSYVGKPSSAYRWSGGFSQGSPVFAHLR